MIGLKNRLLSAFAALLMFAAPAQAQQGTSYTPPLTLGAGVATALGFAPNVAGGFALYASLGTGAFASAYVLPAAATASLGGAYASTCSGGNFFSGLTTATGAFVCSQPNFSGIAGTLTASQLPTTAVTPGSYTNANITVDSYGRLTSASNGSGGSMSIGGAVSGGTANQGLYIASGPVLAQFAYGSGVFTALQAGANASGGVVLLNGSPVSGDLLEWSSTGALDTGISASTAAANCFVAGPNGSSGALACRAIVAADISGLTPTFTAINGTTTASLIIKAGSGQVMYLGAGSAGQWEITGSALLPLADATYNLGSAALRVFNGYFSNAYINSLILPGTSTGADMITSSLTGVTSRTLSTPPGTTADVLVGAAATQTLTNKSINASEVNSGTLAAAQEPARTGDVTSPAGSTINTALYKDTGPGYVAGQSYLPAGTPGLVTGVAGSIQTVYCTYGYLRQTATVQKLGITIPTTAGTTNINLGIYSNYSASTYSGPGALLASTGSFANTGTGLHVAALLSNVQLIAGTPYWFCEMTGDTTMIAASFSLSASNSGSYIGSASGSETAFMTVAVQQIGIYCSSGCYGGTPTTLVFPSVLGASGTLSTWTALTATKAPAIYFNLLSVP